MCFLKLRLDEDESGFSAELGSMILVASFGSFPLTVTVATRGSRSYNSPLIRPPIRTVTGWGNDPMHHRLQKGKKQLDKNMQSANRVIYVNCAVEACLTRIELRGVYIRRM